MVKKYELKITQMVKAQPSLVCPTPQYSIDFPNSIYLSVMCEVVRVLGVSTHHA